MGIQDRDWYKDEIRKRQGYKERAPFRENLTQRRKRTDWQIFWAWAATAVAVIVAIAVAAKWLIRLG